MTEKSGCLIVALIIAIPFLAWCTHVYRCFSDDQWGYLIAGAIMFPLGILHGLGIWLGIW